ncbi:MAG TPA: DUF3617 domain-containing protein [Allosphingosinicella sp.]|nr:DUF3617 domain-containing protein [Allosphingosinicella sp.]
MKTQWIFGAAALALAACGSSDKGGGNEGAAGGGGGSAAGVSLQPGEWEMKTEVVNVTAEGLPPGMAEGMKQSAAATTRTCMTPEEAKGPKGDLFTGDKSGSCKSEAFSWSGGKISGKTTCSDSAGTGQTVMTMDGQYSPQSIDMTIKSETSVAGREVAMEMRMSGKRVGECPASSNAG